MGRPSLLPFDVSDLNLSQREMKFVGEYCANGFNEVEAYKAAGFSDGKGQMTGDVRIRIGALVNKPEIKQAVQRFVESTMSPYRDKLEYQVLSTLKARAFYDPRSFFESDGTAKSLDSIPVELRYAIDQIQEDFKGKNADVRVVTLKLADRMAALKSLQELLKVSKKEEGNNRDEARSKLAEIFAAAGAAGALAGQAAAQSTASEIMRKAMKEAEASTIDDETLSRSKRPEPAPKKIAPSQSIFDPDFGGRGIK